MLRIFIVLILTLVTNVYADPYYKAGCEVLNTELSYCSYDLKIDNPKLFIKMQNKELYKSKNNSIRSVVESFCENTKHAVVVYALIDEELWSGNSCKKGKQSRWITTDKPLKFK